MGLSFTKWEIRLQSGILHYKMGFLGYKRDSHVAIQTLNEICKVLECQPGDIIEYVKDKEENDIS